MCTILLPIKPIYVDRIFNNIKKYEYRKIKPKRNISKILIYATSPVKKIVGEVEVINILEDDKEIIWNSTFKYAGISKLLYDKYYVNSNRAIAYKLGKFYKYNKPLLLTDIGINYIPQSYVYLNNV